MEHAKVNFTNLLSNLHAYKSYFTPFYYLCCPSQYSVNPPVFVVTEAPARDPCQPSPCGPNSLCRNNNGQAVCSCAPDYQGAPPNCRPECVVNNECSSNRACYKFKCTDPCPGTCGIDAQCQVINHNPICSCRAAMTGDPFIRCSPVPGTTTFISSVLLYNSFCSKLCSVRYVLYSGSELLSRTF